ncbi:MAG: hypothetical protein ACTSR2_14760 [Candidatus Hodarchaeales archaeon]
MTAFAKRKRRGRTEIDIATKYFNEEKERTKEILEKKKRRSASKSMKDNSLVNKPHYEKKEYKPKRVRSSKNSSHSPNRKYAPKKNRPRIRSDKLRTVVKKARKSSKKIKRARNQYFQRYNV